MICKNCKGVIPENSNFCPRCGAKAEPEEVIVCTPEAQPASEPTSATCFCGHCGSKQKAGTKFCDNCGQPMDAPQSTFKPSTPKQAKLSKSGRIGIIAAGAAAVVILLAVLISGLFSSGPEATAKKYLNAMNKGDAETVVNLCHPDEIDYYLEYLEAIGWAKWDKDDYIEDLQETYDYALEEHGSISRKILRTMNYNKEEEEYQELKAWFKDELGLRVKGVAAVTVKQENEEGSEYIYELWLVKIGTKWYVTDGFGLSEAT